MTTCDCKTFFLKLIVLRQYEGNLYLKTDYVIHDKIVQNVDLYKIRSYTFHSTIYNNTHTNTHKHKHTQMFDN